MTEDRKLIEHNLFILLDAKWASSNGAYLDLSGDPEEPSELDEAFFEAGYKDGVRAALDAVLGGAKTADAHE